MTDETPACEELLALSVDDRRVATLVAPVGFPRELSPRPFLHPVRTLAGVVVTDERPEDHAWHLGVSVALEDVGGDVGDGGGGDVEGTNYWGGRTYVRDQGYLIRDDHGEVRFEGWDDVGAGHARGRLAWHSRRGGHELTEERSLGWRLLADDAGWELDFAFALRNRTAHDLVLGSPGSNGRPGGGYGGFFWTLRIADALRVETASAVGEEAVHGEVAPWLLVRGDGGGAAQRYSLVFHPGDPATAADPWFVRLTGYPAVGSALAWTEPVRVAAGAAVARRVRVVVADGHLDPADVPGLLGAMR